MKDLYRQLNSHYSQRHLVQNIISAVKKREAVSGPVTAGDLAAMDEFHIQGRKATQNLLQNLEILPGSKIAELGCGIGGTCRLLAAEYRSSVFGVDITDEYCRAADYLSRKLMLSDKIHISRAGISQLPWKSGRFDLAVLQHVIMNIPDKVAMAGEIRRILKSGGKLALFEVFSGKKDGPVFPVPWAESDALNFLVSAEEMRKNLLESGFKILHWLDYSKTGLSWVQKMLAKSRNHLPPVLGLHLLMGSNTREKMQNVIINLEQERICLIQAVVQKF
ncbi:MAG: class I SAM-dependent methyltransferase [Calditrichia bacterium]